MFFLYSFVSLWMTEKWLCVCVCMCVAGNTRLHSLICSFLFSRCSFCLFFFFLTIRLTQLLNTKHECGENHLSSFFCDIDFFPFIRDSPVFSCRFKLLGNDFFFPAAFSKWFTKIWTSISCLFHRSTPSYPSNSSDILLSRHSSVFGTYFSFCLSHKELRLTPTLCEESGNKFICT